MDSDKKQIDLWDYGTDTITITGSGSSDNVLTTDTIDLSSLNLSSTFDYSSLSDTIISQSHTGRYTYDTGMSPISMSPNLTVGTSINTSGTIDLRGDDADIVVNGVSLMDKINAIGERLNMLDINPELEAEWDQLRELGDCYRQLEQELKTKSEMWKTLKTKTPSKPRS
jgi:hypothetical protein